MPSAWWSLGKEIETYLDDLRDAGRNEKTTIKPYKWSLLHMFGILRDNGFTVNPRKVGRKELEFLRDKGIGGSNRYRSNMVKIMFGFLRFAGNKEVAKLKMGFGNTSPTNIRWLEDAQAGKVRMYAKENTKMLVHCELDMGMRRVEVLRLKVTDFLPGPVWRVNLLGKGRNGGKPRQIACHPETPQVLADHMERRNAIIERARRKNPDVVVPDALLIYERGGKLQAYKETALDNMLTDLGDEVGFRFTNHDLRRTFGRMMYRAGVKIEEIARIFGHSNTRMTMHYIGLDMEDMSSAMGRLAAYQASTYFPKTERNILSQEKSGQSGI